jgi:predicted metal-dependent phosphoesterase TrpH
VIVDFHAHTQASDGALAPRELVAKMRARGVRAFSITDHDTLRAYDGLIVEDPVLVPGIEINTTWRGGDVHVLGYGVSLDPNAPLATALAAHREHRRARVSAMTAGLSAAGYPLTDDEVAAEAPAGDVLGRPHVARALLRKGLVSSREAAFRDLLAPGTPGYQPSLYVTPVEAVQLIAAAGGVPVLAHPGRLKDEAILDVLAAHGLLGLEVFYAGHTASQTAHFRRRAAQLGLVMTAGADFHDPRWSTHGVGMDVDEDDLTPFLEMVIA